MRSNYKKIGEFIKKIKLKNTTGTVTELLGINIDKYFMPSVANVVGTDLTKYRVVKKGQFACNRMHVGRDYRLPIALSKSEDDFLVSPAYDVFQIKDQTKLLPEYMMMWFTRSEFDRNAWFHTDTDVRGKLGWDSFCNMELPVPSIEKQREIVAEYNTVVDRIKLNEELNKKLEETAQTLYKHWFVDFEFPDENGNPYKSTGGEMVYNAELEKEIPKGWGVKSLGELCLIGSSKRIFESEYTTNGIPFYRGKEITIKKTGKPISSPLYISKERFKGLDNKYGSPQKGDILLTAVGTIGSSYLVEDENFYFKDGNIIWFKNFNMNDINLYIYSFMQSFQFSELIDDITIGSTQKAITISSLSVSQILFPDKFTLSKFNLIAVDINNLISMKNKMTNKLLMLSDTLLSRMTRV